ncbi:LRRIQ4 [Branchiostoma lanceolatum]|uniref:Leucine-rich repeat protein SHOC-2 n=1 Tax=Branchiostoma lanceolatum TaxID=7740 RepID=A0A8K0EJL3_BRALA|nr:LRRIQ4 [Branchiostoma lanceolatum]
MAAGLNLQPERNVNGQLYLDLSNQGLTSIPEEVFDITDLEVLDVRNNKLTSIPEAIGRLQKLSRLNADGNKLTSLPQAIGSLQGLEKLYVHNNDLSELPDGLEALQKLEWLWVKGNKLTKLPTKMFSCLNLVNFDVSNNKLSTLPPGVEKLQKLRQLYIHYNQLTEVPPMVCSLSNLEVLSVSNNKLSTLPPGVEKLQKLRGLYIDGNQLTEVPPGVCSLSNLEVLSVSNNKLSTFPPGVEKLQKLRELRIHDNQLTEVPPGVCSLPNLELLNVNKNKLSTLPPGVEKLQKLTKLYIDGNQLTEVPPGVCSLSNLEVLVVGPNSIRRLPNDVTRLARLKALDVVGCQFDEFPRQVFQLKTLEKLYAGQSVGCKFDIVPDEVGNLQHLWLLSLENNLLRTLPSTMRRLHNLRVVHLWNNKFDTFPEVLCELPAMEKLDIRNNNITRLPTALHRADKLNDLDVSRNPLTYPPQNVCKQGTDAIMAFLKQEAEKEGEKQSGQEEKGAAAGKVTEDVRDVHVPPVKGRFTSRWHGGDRTGEEKGYCPGSSPVQQQTAVIKSRVGVARKQPVPETSKLTGDNTAEGASPVQASPVQPSATGRVSGAGVAQKQPATLTIAGDNTEQHKDLSLAFSRLSLKVKQSEWKHIARQLGFNNQDIKDVETACPDEPMYEALVRWRQRAGPAASLSVLEQCLRDLDLNQLADQITRTAMSPTGRGHAPERGAVGGELTGEVQSRYPSVTLDRRFPIIEFERLNFPEDSILGRGGFAAVEKAYHRDWSQHVAVKRLLTRQLTGSEQDLLYSEARKLNLGSRSDHVISLLGVCLDPNFAIVMPYMENGSLAELLRDVDVPWALRWRMAHEISLGMTFLHCQNPQILHCDLKAENVLLDGDFHVKISDFGLSKWKMESRVVTQTSPEGSTITHAPPEYFLDINLIPTPKFDVYSFGVLLWEIVTRTVPYGNAVNSALIRLAVTSGQRPDLTLVPTDLPEVGTVSQLMQTCWSQNPEDRPTFQECEDRLRAVASRSSKEDVLQAIIDVQKRKNNPRVTLHHRVSAGNGGSNMAAGLNLQPERYADGLLYLDLSDQGLTSIPEEVFDITDLEFLDVSNNKLTSIPEAIGRLQKLYRLDADGNKLTSLPQAIGSLQKLTQLYIDDNQLTEVPPGVCSLSDLEVLGVGRNRLSTFPPGVEKLRKLTKLGINDNQLTEVPPGVCSLSDLGWLNVSNNKLSPFLPGVEKLQKLTHLYIHDNQLKEVPPGVCCLSNLEVLSVGPNPIRHLPDDVTRLVRLKILDVVGCQFEEFPRQVFQLKTLEKLYAGSCEFDIVPDELGNLQHLWFLALEYNLLRTLPSTMSHLHNLRVVQLWNNKFDTFPEVLCELPAMEKLDIRNNNITRLPTALHRANKLKDLDVSGNPLTYPPQDVCEQGTGAIMAFLKQEAEKDERILQAFNRLSVKVKQTQWKPLARSLGLSSRAMDAIKASAPVDVPDQVYLTLVQWREKEGETATLSALEQHLRDLDFQQLAEQLSRTPRAPDFTGHESEVGAVGGEGSDDPQNRYPSVTVDSKFPIIHFERLEEQSFLGRGGFAYVKKARHLDWRQDVAVKCLLTRQIEGSERDVLYSEARKLKLASTSDHVISLLGVCLDPNFAIVMPYMENGSLAQLLRDVDVPWALRWRMAHEISLGMTFLHCQNPQILHCDLKAENVLLDGDFHVKISDFGLSKWKMESRVVTQTSPEGSTITHAPPEYFLDINLIPTPKFDVYSFGVLLWEMVTRTQPYGNAVNSALIRLAVTSGQRPDLTPIPTDREDVTSVSELMQTCWSQNPEDRPPFNDCADRLRHVKDRFSREEVRQAIIAVEKMKATASRT